MKKILPLLLLFPILCFATPEKRTDPKIIILFGPPASGKGTLSVPLSKNLNIPHISTGSLFRKNLDQNTKIGQKAKEFVKKGLLVPDEIVVDMLFERISQEDCQKGYILDGFPRTLNQALALDKRLKNQNNLKAIHLDIPNEIVIERIAGRLSCTGCSHSYHKKYNPPKQKDLCDKCGQKLIQRKDDTTLVVKKRLESYYQETRPLISYYQKKKVLSKINGNQKKDIVLKDTLLAL